MNAEPTRQSSTRVASRSEQCVICRQPESTWQHRLDPKKAEFMKYGKPHAVRLLWTLCQRCERVYLAGDIDGLCELMAKGMASMDRPYDLAEDVSKPIQVFVAADLGGTEIPG